MVGTLAKFVAGNVVVECVLVVVDVAVVAADVNVVVIEVIVAVAVLEVFGSVVVVIREAKQRRERTPEAIFQEAGKSLSGFQRDL